MQVIQQPCEILMLRFLGIHHLRISEVDSDPKGIHKKLPKKMCGLTITHHHECGHTTYKAESCAQSPSYSPCTQPGTQPYHCPYHTTHVSFRYHPCPACLRWASMAERNRREMEELRYEQAMARWHKREECLRRSTIWQSQQRMGLRRASPLPQAQMHHHGLFLSTSLPPSPSPRALATWDVPQRAGLGRFLPLKVASSDSGMSRAPSEPSLGGLEGRS